MKLFVIRKDIKLFDKDAFREAWFNACLHNDWLDGTPPAIYIFNDRLEIVSTGGLPYNMTKKISLVVLVVQSMKFWQEYLFN